MIEKKRKETPISASKDVKTGETLLWGKLVDNAYFALLRNLHHEFKNRCPWISLNKRDCIAISCTGWGGDYCDVKNCGLIYMREELKL